MKKKLFVLLSSACIASFTANAQEKEKPKWDVNNPMGPSKRINFTVKEGTWMNVDVSPDGKEVIFDLLGDIYSMPITGGKAKLLRGGMAYEVQPRFSPNGKSISFTSDAGGGDNIWLMNRDGSNARQLTKESFRLLNNAVWTPDNQYIIARKHFTGFRSLGAGEMWMYHISGGDGIQLTKKKNDQQDAGEPALSPDGRYLYWSEDVTPGPYFQYNKDPYSGIYAIKSLDRQTGEIKEVTGGPGGAIRPQVSPNGKLLAFVKRVRLESVLYLQNLETGEEWPIYHPLSHDQQEAWAIFGPYTNFNWTPDSKNIIISAKGKIWNVDVAQKLAKEIPFEVNAELTITDALHFKQQVFSDQFEAKMIRDAITSPDGKKLVFNAVGYLYSKELPNGKPQRITKATDFEFDPSFSPDGNALVYISWNDESKGSIVRFDFKTGKTQKLTTEKGFYYTPSFSPNGEKVVFRKGSGNELNGFSFGKNPGLYILTAGSGVSKFICEEGSQPQFNGDGSRIFFLTSENGKKLFKSVDLNGTNPISHFTSQYANQFVVSPDNKWIAFTELFQAYVAPFPIAGSAVDLSGKSTAIPVFKVSKDAGTCLHWSKDSQKLHWVLGTEYFTRSIQNSFNFVDGAPSTIPPVDSTGIKIGLVLPSDVPNGKLALKGARIISMKNDEVIENGIIIIENNKITALGNVSSITIPSDAKVIDVTGKTIMPGMVDVHAHIPAGAGGITAKTQWPYYANLAFGVTTTHDPSNNTEMVFTQSEMEKAGAIVGPRIYSTGTILYGADGDFKAVINSLDDARSHLRRLKAVGAFSVKSYNQPRREQRQQIIQAARELQMEVVPEGGSTYTHNMSMIMDGHTGIEHNIPVSDVYADVKQLWNATKTQYTPTLIVAYGGLSGENYWYDRTNVWEDNRLLNFSPRSVIDARSRRRQTTSESDYNHFSASKICKYLSDGGTKVNLGSHGQIQGIGAHWEMWMLAQGGMSPMEVIRCATMNGAEYLGMDKEIGSLEVGKLADLIVMDKNPLENIRNTESIKYVMLNGRLYDAETMNEVGNYNKPRGKFFWEEGNNSETFKYNSLTSSFLHSGCSCYGVH
ncbi:amidohydrolase family protein [Solitalea sp. MAHUQ-68]|uniref:Amidohydrolase family protein n=1 Tax=Solitalea agri TaxID=2953739 RepID=A0A9X2F9C7_9SPHI|nr:amidohydrolase family protein [Solitalea agri]MCO4294721.1 amidohydrolase family protein [Solitalea agri]